MIIVRPFDERVIGAVGWNDKDLLSGSKFE